MTLGEDIAFRTMGQRLTDEPGCGRIRVENLARHAPRSRLVT